MPVLYGWRSNSYNQLVSEDIIDLSSSVQTSTNYWTNMDGLGVYSSIGILYE